MIGGDDLRGRPPGELQALEQGREPPEGGLVAGRPRLPPGQVEAVARPRPPPDRLAPLRRREVGLRCLGRPTEPPQRALILVLLLLLATLVGSSAGLRTQAAVIWERAASSVSAPTWTPLAPLLALRRAFLSEPGGVERKEVCGAPADEVGRVPPEDLAGGHGQRNVRHSAAAAKMA